MRSLQTSWLSCQWSPPQRTHIFALIVGTCWYRVKIHSFWPTSCVSLITESHPCFYSWFWLNNFELQWVISSCHMLSVYSCWMCSCNPGLPPLLGCLWVTPPKSPKRAWLDTVYWALTRPSSHKRHFFKTCTFSVLGLQYIYIYVYIHLTYVWI